eukprot:TRINITY_DN45307_c0_g1_i3.p1 TRINITY_DN45307_c0_g1~~TRINITY_DN45307_c0_g1_i3.p1  ORF type:complete len:663 (+),score=118.42 TRINITY_DN45307_c0_g1_i3:129-2117(+)
MPFAAARVGMLQQPLTHYERLGLSQGASEAEVRKAFRERARTCHPDKCDDADAAERFRCVREAFETLSCPSKRRDYDFALARGALGKGAATTFGPAARRHASTSSAAPAAAARTAPQTAKAPEPKCCLSQLLEMLQSKSRKATMPFLKKAAEDCALTWPGGLAEKAEIIRELARLARAELERRVLACQWNQLEKDDLVFWLCARGCSLRYALECDSIDKNQLIVLTRSYRTMPAAPAAPADSHQPGTSPGAPPAGSRDSEDKAAEPQAAQTSGSSAARGIGVGLFDRLRECHAQGGLFQRPVPSPARCKEAAKLSKPPMSQAMAGALGGLRHRRAAAQRPAAKPSSAAKAKAAKPESQRRRATETTSQNRSSRVSGGQRRTKSMAKAKASSMTRDKTDGASSENVQLRRSARIQRKRQRSSSDTSTSGSHGDDESAASSSESSSSSSGTSSSQSGTATAPEVSASEPVAVADCQGVAVADGNGDDAHASHVPGLVRRRRVEITPERSLATSLSGVAESIAATLGNGCREDNAVSEPKATGTALSPFRRGGAVDAKKLSPSPEGQRLQELRKQLESMRLAGIGIEEAKVKPWLSEIEALDGLGKIDVPALNTSRIAVELNKPFWKRQTHGNLARRIAVLLLRWMRRCMPEDSAGGKSSSKKGS